MLVHCWKAEQTQGGRVQLFTPPVLGCRHFVVSETLMEGWGRGVKIKKRKRKDALLHTVDLWSLLELVSSRGASLVTAVSMQSSSSCLFSCVALFREHVPGCRRSSDANSFDSPFYQTPMPLLFISTPSPHPHPVPSCLQQETGWFFGLQLITSGVFILCLCGFFFLCIQTSR